MNKTDIDYKMEELAVQLLAKHVLNKASLYSDAELKAMGRVMTKITGSPSRKSEILAAMENKG